MKERICSITQCTSRRPITITCLKETTRRNVLNITKQVDYVRTSHRIQIKFNIINYCEANYHAVYPLSLLCIALITLLLGNK